MSSGLNFFTNAVDVTPGTTGSWQDVDVSAHIPAESTGVILFHCRTATNTIRVGVRKNGSSDDYYCETGNSVGIIIGVDANRIFEAEIEDNTQSKLYLIGYTDSNVILFDNCIDKSTDTAGSYQDVDISGNGVPSGATGAIFFFHNTVAGAVDYDCALRKNGSSDDIYAEVEGETWGGILWGTSGLDANRVCEQKIESTYVDLKLIGYTNTPVVFLDNAVDKSLSTTGSWQDIDLTSDTAADADGAIFTIRNTLGTAYLYGLQHNDSTDDLIGYILTSSLEWRYVGLDSGQVCKGYINNVAVDFYLRGYCHPATAVTEKTSSDVGSGAESKVLSAILVKAETGSGVDAVDSLQTPMAKSASDAGSGVEGTPLLGATLTGSETGSGIEALVARLLAAFDTGGGVEASSVETDGQLKNLFANELGEGSDCLTAKIEMPTKGGGMRLWT